MTTNSPRPPSLHHKLTIKKPHIKRATPLKIASLTITTI
jgi:hypothetical protein